MASEKESGATRSKLSMKLLVDTKAQRVLYAEAGKDVVDFLFTLLTLPVGTVVKLLTPDSMVGSIGSLYASVDKFDDTYICSDDAKSALLTPAGGSGSMKLLQLPAAAPPPESAGLLYRCTYNSSYNNTTYNCSYNDTTYNSSPGRNYKTKVSDNDPCRNYVTKVLGTPCPNCNQGMRTLVHFAPLNAGSGVSVTAARSAVAGFVQRVMTYTVMDDLKVVPMSTISGITLLNEFNITDIGSLQEKIVQLGYTEGLEILKMSLQSKTVLTDVFLGKKRKA